MIERRGQALQVQRLELLENGENFAHGEIVRNAAVDEMKIGALLAIFVVPKLLQVLNRAGGRARHVGRSLEAREERRLLVTAGAGVVVDRHRRQHDRHARRRCRRARQPDGAQVRAQDVEHLLREVEPCAGAQVGRRRDDHRPRAALQIGERCAIEQDLVIEIRGELGAAPVRRAQRPPVNGIQGPADQLALNIALEKALLVFAEQPVAIQAVGQRGEAATGNPGDDIDRVEQPLSLAVAPDHLGVSQRFEDPVRERGGARSAARERQDDDVLLVARILLPGLESGIRQSDPHG